MIVNRETLKKIVESLKGKKITHENIKTACLKLGFENPPKINIGKLVQTSEGYWTSIYYNNMSEQFAVDENDTVL